MPNNKDLFRGVNKALIQGLKTITLQPILIHSKLDQGVNISYQKAIQIAAEYLLYLNNDQISALFDGLIITFEGWREAYGIYPPLLKGGIRAIAENKKRQMPARDYIKNLELISKNRQKPVIPHPWECCDLADSSVELFLKLHEEKYSPTYQVS